MSEENIIVFRPDADFPLTKRHKPRCKCSQLAGYGSYASGIGVWVDEHTRALECRTCGARIEAFDYLWAMSTEGNSLDAELKRLREAVRFEKAQVKVLEDQVKDLKAERNRLKREASKGVA